MRRPCKRRGGGPYGSASLPWLCWHCLQLQEWSSYCFGGDRPAVVVPDRAHPPDQVGRKLQPEKVVHLAVTVLLDHVDALVGGDELSDRAGQRQRADPQG